MIEAPGAPAIDWVNLSVLAQDSSLLPKGNPSSKITVAYAKDHRHGRLLLCHLPNPLDKSSVLAM